MTEAVAAVEPAGVRAADGTLHEADVLIWGTGFAATDFLGGIEVTGRGGADLGEVWADGRARLPRHRGAGLPQPVLHLRPQHQPRRQLDHRHARGPGRLDRRRSSARIADGGHAAYEVRPEVSDAYDREMQPRLGDSVWSGCDSWYKDGGRITTNWPGLVAEYQSRLREVDWDDLRPVP